MRVRGVFCAIVLVGFSLLSCEAATQLEGTDDMAPGSAGAVGGGGAASCATCYDSTCAWQASSCAGDPECARWLTCARGCAPGDGGNPSKSCWASCPEPASHGGVQLRGELSSCIDRSGGCCGDGNKGLDAGSEPSEADDAGPTGWWDGDGSPALNGSWCAGATCKDCLLSIKGNANACVADDPACTDMVAACIHEPPVPGAPFAGLGNCANFMLAFGGCATDPAFTEHTVDQCIWVVPPDSVEGTLDAARCGAVHCTSCAPSGEEGCVACQVDSCRFEMAALLGDGDAQGLFWCLRKCATADDLASCRGACGTQYPNGVPVVTALNQCIVSSCAGVCQN